MDSLPRDVQLQIIKWFDMETRIKTGIIFKLSVPVAFKKRLHKLCVHHSFAYDPEHHLDVTLQYLSKPYAIYLDGVNGPHKPNMWLDKWYEREWPEYLKIYDGNAIETRSWKVRNTIRVATRTRREDL